MSEDKKDLKLENELLACGFTQKDVVKIYEAADSLSPNDIIKRIKILRMTSIVMLIILIITAVGMIWTLDEAEYFMTDAISALVIFILMASIINYMMPFKIGVKATVFLFKLNKKGH